MPKGKPTIAVRLSALPTAHSPPPHWYPPSSSPDSQEERTTQGCPARKYGRRIAVLALAAVKQVWGLWTIIWITEATECQGHTKAKSQESRLTPKSGRNSWKLRQALAAATALENADFANEWKKKIHVLNHKIQTLRIYVIDIYIHVYMYTHTWLCKCCTKHITHI